MTKPFFCQKCKTTGKRHKARDICETCVSPKEKAAQVGFDALSQRYLNKRLRQDHAP